MQPLGEFLGTSERCAPFRKSLSADPIGSAGNYDAFLAVEVPLPWERDISLHEPFASLATQRTPFASLTAPDGRIWRPQGLVSTTAGPPNAVRVIAYEKRRLSESEAALFVAQRVEFAAPFERREWLVPTLDLVPLAQALLAADESALASYEQYRATDEAEVIDLFICTHGKRDVCCGQSGMALFSEISASLAEPDHPLPQKLRVWRASHTGGHRFAPTALSFPDGYAWAYLDSTITEQILCRSGQSAAADLAVALEHCRGVSSLSSGPAQVADRAALAAVGWAWASSHRTVEVVEFDRHSFATSLLISGTPVGGPTRSFRVEVDLQRHIPQITCGVIDSPEYDVEPVWAVAAINEV
jgi:hypothetical protein